MRPSSINGRFHAVLGDSRHERTPELEGGAARGELLGLARARRAPDPRRVGEWRVDRDHPESRKGRRKSSPLFFTEEVRGGVHTCRASIDPISHAPERLAINQKTSMIFGHTPRSILPTRKLQRSVVQRRSNPHQRRIGFASWKE